MSLKSDAKRDRNIVAMAKKFSTYRKDFFGDKARFETVKGYTFLDGKLILQNGYIMIQLKVDDVEHTRKVLEEAGVPASTFDSDKFRRILMIVSCDEDERFVIRNLADTVKQKMEKDFELMEIASHLFNRKNFLPLIQFLTDEISFRWWKNNWAAFESGDMKILTRGFIIKGDEENMNVIEVEAKER